MKKIFILVFLITAMLSQTFAGVNDSSGNFELRGFGYGFSAGVWLPTGHLSVLGVHPCFGAHFDCRNEKIIVDVNFNARVGSSPNEYFVKRLDSVYKTTHFASAFGGIGFGYVINRKRNREITLIGGIGGEEISMLSVVTNKGDTLSRETASFNANIGIGYKLFIHHVYKSYIVKHSYLGLQAKYNYVHYINDGGTNLSGNSFMIMITYGTYARNI